MKDSEILQYLQTAREINTPFDFCDMMIEILQEYEDKDFICKFLNDNDKILIARYILWKSKRKLLDGNEATLLCIKDNIDILFSVFSTYGREFRESCWINTFVYCLYFMDQNRIRELNFFFLRGTGGLILRLLNTLDKDVIYERFYNIADCNILHLLNDNIKSRYLEVYERSINYIHPLDNNIY